MAEGLAKQLQLQRIINRSLENFKKLGRGNMTPAKVRSRILYVKETWQQFLDGHTILLKVMSDETRSSLEYFTEEVFEATEEQYQCTLDFMTECLEDLEPVVSPTQSFANSTRLRAEASAMSVSHLPSIKLPPFNGNYEEWEPFRDRFKSIIINNRELDDFARMHFLTSCLKDRAFDAIAHISITADNFEIAWSTLTARYESKQRTLHKHFSALFGLTELTRESAVELQSLYDKTSSAVAALKKLDRSPADLWNDMLVYNLVQKLDPVTRKAWKLKVYIGSNESPPAYEELNKFLQNRAQALEEISAHSAVKAAQKSASVSRVHVATASAGVHSLCPLCQRSHFLNVCPVYVSKNASQRREIVKSQKRCFNCLSAKHAVTECQSKYSCRVCKKKHHSTLHIDSPSHSTRSEADTREESAQRSHSNATAVNSLIATPVVKSRQQVLLATAWVTVRVPSGRSVIIRALLDQGSEMTFISEHLAQILRVKRIRMPLSIAAVGGTHAGNVKHAAHIVISSRHSCDPSFDTTALILNSLTSYAPKRQANMSDLTHLSDLTWADDDPTSSEPINIIIGAELYPSIIREGIRKGKTGKPFAQNSEFGWVISGPLNATTMHTQTQSAVTQVLAHHVTESRTLDDEIRRFWEIEEIPRQSIATPLEIQCENHFQSTHSRSSDGRYVVRLPFKQGPPIDIGESKCRATRMFHAIARRGKENSALAQDYHEFMAEYEQLGHMKLASTTSAAADQSVYIPHHAVIRESSATTRLRVVFNASSVTSNGSSLNDHLLTGPKLQTEITSVISHWRSFRYVYSADITKMYRQIWVDARDVNYQRILWTAERTATPLTYQLLTVTYGTACAPFLALRVLEQLRKDEGHAFPLASAILKDHIYVDDVLFGANNMTLLRQERDQLILLLKRGGFSLRKWASNKAALLSDLDEADHGLACSKQLAEDEHLKILGVAWNPSLDVFEFKVSHPPTTPKSKRSILSTIAKFYDPLGWVTPVTVAAKIFLQQLWRHNLSWDDSVPDNLLCRWNDIYFHFSCLSNLQIPRWNGMEPDMQRAEIHGFADASNLAYAAVVYLKVISSSGAVTVTLLAAKSKIAPLKTLSIPRLELSAALLLSRLVEFIRSLNEFSNLPGYCWTDSTVVLAWVTQHPSRWKTFVANRVTEIQSRLSNIEWRHVPTHENPADCASRGILGNEIRDHALWWNGPPWLKLELEHWPPESEAVQRNPPLEERAVALQCSQRHDPWSLASRYSSWPKLIRVTAYLIRFIQRCKESRNRVTTRCQSTCPCSNRRGRCQRCGRDLSNQNSSSHRSDTNLALTAEECRGARTFWIKQMQSELFAEELKVLSKDQPMSSKSLLRSLKPFLDSDGILRVGGRLEQAPYPFSFRHPIVLAAHPIVTLIASQAHVRALHSGPQLTLNLLRRDFWIVRARNLVKSVIYKCVKCTRERAATPTQLMGNLPKTRVSASSRSFDHCGVDYAGPVHIRASSGRGVASRKAYIALFVCLATKAIHLELVSDCSTTAFISAFARFCSRRGLPRAVYSDNATTFVGADREITLAYRAALRDANFLNQTASDNISWHFIPPSAPHFGGLWEAGVKSVKYHLRRVVSHHKLTFEEFTTLLCRIEACLNSRPLAPLTDILWTITNVSFRVISL